MPKYQERLATRKREFGRVCSTLSDNGNGHDTTIPAPLGEGYTRNYWATPVVHPDFTPLPHERLGYAWLRKWKRFDY